MGLEVQLQSSVEVNTQVMATKGAVIVFSSKARPLLAELME